MLPTPAAVLNKKICYDIDDRCVLHFHDWTVPPEEEVLATKLILEHREAWLRNEATVLQQDSKGGWHDLSAPLTFALMGRPPHATRHE